METTEYAMKGNSCSRVREDEKVWSEAEKKTWTCQIVSQCRE